MGGVGKGFESSGRTAGDEEKLYDSSSDGPPQLLADSNKLQLSAPIGIAVTGSSSVWNRDNKYYD